MFDAILSHLLRLLRSELTYFDDPVSLAAYQRVEYYKENLLEVSGGVFYCTRCIPADDEEGEAHPDEMTRSGNPACISVEILRGAQAMYRSAAQAKRILRS